MCVLLSIFAACFSQRNVRLISQQAEHTFILALDGDIDFKPDAVRLLTDRLKKNMKTAAACGRIHPVGTGESAAELLHETAVDLQSKP